MKTLHKITAIFIATTLLFSCGGSDDSVDPSNGGDTNGVTITTTDFSESIDENSVNGTVLGSLVASASDDSSVTYTLDNQNVSGALALSSSGELTIADETAFDYETNSQITASYTASSGDVSETGNVTINLNNLGATKILLLASESTSGMDDVKDILEATNSFETIDIHNAGSALITTTELNAYDAVLVWANFNFFNPSSLGDNLAAYIDNGGAVVEAGFSAINGDRVISGDYLDYNVYTGTNHTRVFGTVLTLGTTDNDHPILDGVTSFNGGNNSYHFSDISLESGVVEVAQWSNGKPLVLVREDVGDSSSKVVYLNFYPLSDNVTLSNWDTDTDGGILLSNALKFVGDK